MVRRGILGAALASLALIGLSGSASARNAYVANSGAGTVSVLSTTTNGSIATIPVGAGPADVAIGPDGHFAYIANATDGTISVIDTTTNAVVGQPIPVGAEPHGVAVTPDGRFVYAANSGSNSVSVISTASNAIVGTPIPVGTNPDGIAIAPDGRTAYVAQRGGDISVIDTSTNAVVGAIADGVGPSRIVIGPRGGRAYVTNSTSNSVFAINPATRAVVGSPIVVGSQPAGVAITPNGQFAYAASTGDGTLTRIDTSLDAAAGPAISGFPGATGIAIKPDGSQGYVTNGAGAVTLLDAVKASAAGSVAVGATPTGVAIVPDQGPSAGFFASPSPARAGKAITFRAGASKDPDGTIAAYAWDFGDGKRATGPQVSRKHTYKKPGTFTVTLVVTDNEGCSTAFIYTGQTTSCNGSTRASSTGTVTVLDSTRPVLQVAGARRQRLRGHLNAFAQCPREPCAVRARGTVVTVRPTDDFGKGHRLGRAQALLPAGGWGRLSLRLPRRTRIAAARALRKGGSAKAELTIIARDSSGNETRHNWTIRLLLAGRHGRNH